MRTRSLFLVPVIALALAVASSPLWRRARAGETPGGPVAMAQAFLASLDAPRRRVAHLAFGAPERFEWEYRPGSRSGLALGQMTPAQRAAAAALWRSGLAAEGLRRIEAVLLRERLLQGSLGASARQRQPAWRDPGLYHLTVFGSPAPDASWSWRLDGHHLSVHLTYVGDRLVGSSPAFLGGNPATTRSDGHVARATLEAWRAFWGALDGTQRAAAYAGKSIPGDIVMQPGRARTGPPPGLAASSLDASQAARLLALLATYPPGTSQGEPDLPGSVDALGGVRIRVRGDVNAVRAHHVEIAGPRFAAEHRDPGDHCHLLWRTASDHGARAVPGR